MFRKNHDRYCGYCQEELKPEEKSVKRWGASYHKGCLGAMCLFAKKRKKEGASRLKRFFAARTAAILSPQQIRRNL